MLDKCGADAAGDPDAGGGWLTALGATNTLPLSVIRDPGLKDIDTQGL